MSKNDYEVLPDPLQDRVCTEVELPPNKPMPTNLLFDKSNNNINYIELMKFLTKEGKVSKKDFKKIIHMFTSLTKKEPNIIKIDDPVTIIGDIHGQYYDLLKIIEVAGTPEESKYCFLGDLVDRGIFSTEVILLIFAMKISYPDLVFILRGNHESRQMTSHFNFRTECLVKYDVEIYELLMDAFDTLPLAAIVNKKFFSVHGGISPSTNDIESIQKLNRFSEVPSKGIICDLLWSDPINEETEALNLDWEENSNRNCSYFFGAKSLLPYLASNTLVSVIRAHEVQLDGFKMYKWNKLSDFPTCVTVFSAPNYCDVYNNKGAIIKFKNNLFNLLQYNCVSHPFILPDFHNSFSWSLPFISEKCNFFI